MKKIIYADYNATTPPPPGHEEQVLKVLHSSFGSPSSIHHFGREAKRLMEEAREHVANVFGTDRKGIIFTSGATEANNLCMKGVVFKHYKKKGDKPHIIITNSEHSSVHNVARFLEDYGFCDVTFAPIHQQGYIEKEILLSAINARTVFIGVIYVNNETGVINRVEELAGAIKQKGPHIHFHVDGVQAFGKLDCTWIGASQVDSVSVSAHKVGGLKGIGCLYKKPDLTFPPLLHGGGHERGWRSGTENMPGIVSFGLRSKAILENKDPLNHLRELWKHLVEGMRKLPGVELHGELERCLPTTLNFTVKGVAGEELMLLFERFGIAVSSGSACLSGGGEPSRVLTAMGYSREIAGNSIRLSFGEGSRREDVDAILLGLARMGV